VGAIHRNRRSSGVDCRGASAAFHRGGRRTRFAYLRLLFRAGLLANFREVEAGGVAEANHWANLLLADTAAETSSNVAAYEQLYGRCEAWPGWLRSGRDERGLTFRTGQTLVRERGQSN
jgi:hypothetical protein